jgi:peptidoglycan/xylan/chitin deacetylase (PgdA/CDA1 family)
MSERLIKVSSMKATRGLRGKNHLALQGYDGVRPGREAPVWVVEKKWILRGRCVRDAGKTRFRQPRGLSEHGFRMF